MSGFSRQNRGEGNGKSRVGSLPPPDRGEELVDPDLRLRFGPFDFQLRAGPAPELSLFQAHHPDRLACGLVGERGRGRQDTNTSPV